MKRILFLLLSLTLILSAFFPECAVLAEGEEEPMPGYTDITNTLSSEDREALSSYLCRFGACYTTDFEAESGGKEVFDTSNWTDKMSEIIWWQFLAYSKRDRLNPNAPISGQTKIVTSETLRLCVKNTFGLDYTPSAVEYVADDYYIDHADGDFHPPQQNPSGTMWTRSPESCKIQYLVQLEDGTYLIHFIPEYLESANGMHNGSLYYAKFKTADTSCGYVATELGTVSALDDIFIKMGFLEDAKQGSQAISNVNIDYDRTSGYSTIDEYAEYLDEILMQLGDDSPSGPAVNDLAAYISAAALRNSKIELTAENNTVTIDLDTITDSAGGAVNTSNTLWGKLDERGIKPNKDIVIPIEIVVKGLTGDSAPTVVFDESLRDEDLGFSNMRILIGDNSHSIIMDSATCDRIIDTYGSFSVEMGMSVSGGYIISFYDQAGNYIEKLPTKVNFSIPASDKYDSVYNTADGRDFNIGGIYDEVNGAIEFKTNGSGLYKVKNNTPSITDIDDLDESIQEHIRLLVSKDYFTANGGKFKPDDQYTNYDAARAVAGILFTVDTDARTAYNDVDDSDPQALYVASIEEAGIQIYADQGGLRFNGNSAVGLEDSYVLSLDLLIDYKGYYMPDLGDDSDRPYASIYLNYPDIQYMDKDSLGELALGAREGIINDGMALNATENRFDRAEAAEFIYRLFERMCEVSGAKFDAGDNGYASSAAFYNPLKTMSFETPPIVYLYLGCFVFGLIFAVVLYIMQKKHKIVNETAEDAGGEDDYWDEY